MDNLKIFKKLPIPKDSSWDRKTYNPFVLLDSFIYKKFKYTLFYDWYDKIISTPIWNFIGGIKNIIKWFPIIWKDRNWDDYYIFEILKQKLIFQREYLIKHNRHLGIDQINRDITICLNLIERFQNSYYEIEYLNYKKSEFIFAPTEDKFENEDLFEIKDELIWEKFDEFLSKYKSSTRFLLKNGWRTMNFDLEDKNKLSLFVSHYNHNKCKKLIFKILENRIESFWD